MRQIQSLYCAVAVVTEYHLCGDRAKAERTTPLGKDFKGDTVPYVVRRAAGVVLGSRYEYDIVFCESRVVSKLMTE